jgi:hypothetical protein
MLLVVEISVCRKIPTALFGELLVGDCRLTALLVLGGCTINGQALREEVSALEMEIERLDGLRQRIDATTHGSVEVPVELARLEGRIRCTLQIAVTSLERDTSLLDTRLKLATP